MKFRRGSLILLASASLILPALPFLESSQDPIARGATSQLKMVLLKVKSPERDFPIRNVYELIPAVPKAEVGSLPVVYMLHGWPGSPNGLIAGVKAPLSAAFARGVAPFIAVFPDGNATTHSDSEWADSYDKRAMIETWLTTNVIATVEAGDIRDRSDRAILGFSMGGYGAAIIGLHHPELFGQVVTLAGYFLIDDLTNAFGSGSPTDKKHLYQTPVTFLKSAKKIRWFLGESGQDYTQLIRGQAAAWSSKLKRVKATYSTSSTNGGHSYVFVSSEIPIVTKWFKWGHVSAPQPSASPVTTSAPISTPSPSA